MAQLAAAAVDELRVANWYRTEDGVLGRNEPKRIPRPGVEQRRTYEAIDIDDARRRLAEKRNRTERG